jgi:hypothetical protein
MGLFGRLLVTLLLLLAGLAGVVALISERQPLVPVSAALDAGQRAWARHWLHLNDPRWLPEGAKVDLTITEEEASRLANYLIARLGSGRAQVRIAEGRAEVLGSIRLPWSSIGAWLNLHLDVTAEAGVPRVEAARIGGLPLPQGLVKLLADRAMEGLTRAKVLDDLTLESGKAEIAYTWRRAVVDTVGTNLLAPDEQARVLAYQAQAMALAAEGPPGSPLPLANLLTGLLREARSRSRDGDRAVENRAVLAAAFAYANRRLVRDLDAGGPVRPPVVRPVVLRGRRDLAQHFTSSAVVAAQGSSLVSDAVGLFKEMSDADGGSGFSFVDLAADRAGVRFAELATDGASGAGRLQRAATAGLAEDDLMIPIDGLPEAISQAKLERVYGGTQGKAYRLLVGRIEDRIGRLPLYRLTRRQVAGDG